MSTSAQCKWDHPKKSPHYSLSHIKAFVRSIRTDPANQSKCIKSMVEQFERSKHQWINNVEDIPMHMLRIAEKCFFKGPDSGYLMSFLQEVCQLTFSIGWSVMPGEENFSTGKTVWNMSNRHISMFINRQLIPYCYIDSECLAQKYYEQGYVSDSDKNSCKFQVGGIGCRKVGCVFEIIVHEICHVLEYCFRSLLKQCDWDIKYSSNDDENEIFREILYTLTCHHNPYNNLLDRSEQELVNPFSQHVRTVH